MFAVVASKNAIDMHSSAVIAIFKDRNEADLLVKVIHEKIAHRNGKRDAIRSMMEDWEKSNPRPFSEGSDSDPWRSRQEKEDEYQKWIDLRDSKLDSLEQTIGVSLYTEWDFEGASVQEAESFTHWHLALDSWNRWDKGE